MEQTQTNPNQSPPKNDVMHKLALQIVERRNLIFLIVIILLIFSVISKSWVTVENDLTTYLPDESDTRAADGIIKNASLPNLWNKKF